MYICKLYTPQQLLEPRRQNINFWLHFIARETLGEQTAPIFLLLIYIFKSFFYETFIYEVKDKIRQIKRFIGRAGSVSLK